MKQPHLELLYSNNTIVPYIIIVYIDTDHRYWTISLSSNYCTIVISLNLLSYYNLHHTYNGIKLWPLQNHLGPLGDIWSLYLTKVLWELCDTNLRCSDHEMWRFEWGIYSGWTMLISWHVLYEDLSGVYIVVEPC